MKKITISAELEVFDDLGQLTEDVQELMAHADAAREKSYSPYSKFRVGAAILLENGEIITGSNQENASYPAGLCAERTAIFYAGAQYPGVRMLKMALSSRSDLRAVDIPTPPCGSCRQAIAEYEVKQREPIEIYFMGEKGEFVRAASISDLLPLVFDNSFL